MKSSSDYLIEVFGSMIDTIIDLSELLLTLFISCLIATHLRLRSQYNMSLFYPDNPDKFPYVFYDKNVTSGQQYLVSSIPRNNIKEEDSIFESIPLTNKNNYCYFNDYYNVLNECNDSNQNVNNHFKSYIKKNLNYDNMNILSKYFIQCNTNKNSENLNVYGMFSYVMINTTTKLNGVLGSIEKFLNPIFTRTFKNEQNKMKYFNIFFTIFSINLIQKLISNDILVNSNFFNKFINSNLKGSLNNNDDNKINEIDRITGKIFSFIAYIISTFFSPFYTFFKIFMIIIYPFSLFFMLWSYINFSTFSSSYILKLLCYIGIGTTIKIFVDYLNQYFMNDDEDDSQSCIKDHCTKFKNMINSDDINTIINDQYRNIKTLLTDDLTNTISQLTGTYIDVSYTNWNIADDINTDISDSSGSDSSGCDISYSSDSSGSDTSGSNFSFSLKNNDLTKDISNTFTDCSNIDYSDGVNIIQFLKKVVQGIFFPIIILYKSIPLIITTFIAFGRSKNLTIDYIYYIFDIIKFIQEMPASIIYIIFTIIITYYYGGLYYKLDNNGNIEKNSNGEKIEKPYKYARIIIFVLFMSVLFIANNNFNIGLQA